MSYDVHIYRVETMQSEKQAVDKQLFWDNDINAEPFTNQQRQQLHIRLLNYNYVADKEENDSTSYRHEDDLGIAVLLTDRALYFSATGEGIFEISMTASEFTDTGEFAKYDVQNGGWEEID
jgi:hypothetical protein